MKKRLTVFALLAALCLPLLGCDTTDNPSSGQPDVILPPENVVRAGTAYPDKAYGFQLEAPAAGETVAILHTSLGDISLRFFPEAAPKTVENFTTHAKNGYYNGLTFHRVVKDFMVQGGDPQGTGAGGESIWGKAFEDEFDSKLLNLRGSVAMANSGPNTNGSQFFINQADASSPYTGSKAEFVKQSQTLTDNFNDYVTQVSQMYTSYLNAYGTSFRTRYPTLASYWYNFFLSQYFPLNANVVPDEVWALYQQHGGNLSLDGAYRYVGGHTVFAQVYDGMDVVDAIAAVPVDSNSKPTEAVTIQSIEVLPYQP